MMKKTLLLSATALSLLLTTQHSAYAADSSLGARIESLEQEIKILKRQNELNQEDAKAKAEKTPTVEYGKKGFSVTSPDKKYSLKLRGYAQVDGRFFSNDDNHDDVDTFLARRVRPILEATVGNDLSFRIMPDLGGTSPKLFDAHGDYAFSPAANVRVGKFKPPVGLERLQSATDTAFIERGLPTNLVPTRDFGVQVYGELIPDTLEYQVGVFNGIEDLGNNESDVDDKKDIAARIFTHPFKKADVISLQGFGIGVGGTYGEREGSVTTPSLGDFRTPGQARFFRYRAGTTAADTAVANGTQWRLAPQAYYYYSSFGLLGEYTISSQDVTRGSTSANLENKAWQVEASYVLTGEDASFKGVKPDQAFDPKNGGWGAVELVGRYGELDVDNAAFPLFSDPTRSASKAQTLGTGANWYLNENVKLALNYEHTDFEGGATGGRDRETEQVVLTRAQFKF